MQVNTYLFFKGNCQEALQFYEERLGAKVISLFKFAESPMAQQVGPELQDKVMHSRFQLGETIVMASDGSVEHPEDAKGFSMSLSYPEPAEAERVFQILAENGTVRMPIAANILGGAVRNADRPVRHSLDGELRRGGVNSK